MEQIDTKKPVEDRLEAMLEKLKADPLKVTPETVASLWEPAREAWEAYCRSMDNYDRDLKERQAVLDRQGQELDEQIRGLEKKIKAMEEKSRDVASRGDLDAAAKADEEAEGLRSQKATARRKRRIATSTELRGDADLFETIKKAKAEYDSSFTLCQGAVREAIGIVKEWVEHFEKLEKDVRWATNRGPGDGGYTAKRWDAIDRAFNKEYYDKLAEQDAKRREKEKAEQAHREAVRSGRYLAI